MENLGESGRELGPLDLMRHRVSGASEEPFTLAAGGRNRCESNAYDARRMAALDQLGAADVRQVVIRFRDALRIHQEALNRLNVYPVPDGDTGTNMTLTLESVVQELSSAEGMPEVCEAMAHGSLMGARGNSGVILSQILRGLAEIFRREATVDAAAVATGLRTAADAAYQAVMRPVEGTILTVVRWAAEAAEGARDEGARTLVDLLDEAAAAARQAVAQTPEMLPVLRDAGVVDAGGQGFTLLLDAFLEVVDGRRDPRARPTAPAPAIVEAHAAHGDVSELRYEVMYLLDAPDGTIPAFKSTWAGLGDSIVVVGGDGLWNCHVHTDDIGGAIEAGIEAGTPHTIRVTDLLEQVEEERWVEEAAAPAPIVHAPEDLVATAVVAVAVGDGVRRLLASLGVQEIVAGGQSMNPSTAQILEAVERCPSDSVIVLPNNKNIVAVARQVDDLTEKSVAVVPTHSVVEALGALVGYDPDADLGTNVTALAEAVGHVSSGEVTQSVRDTVAECGPIRKGDWIAIGREGICVATDSPADAAFALIDDLVEDDSEIVTVLVGSDARGADTPARPRAPRVPPSGDGDRGARGWAAALPLPDRGGVATAAGTPRTLRALATTPLAEIPGIPARTLDKLAAMSPAIDVGARPARALPAALPRPDPQVRDRRARGRRGGDDRRRGPADLEPHDAATARRWSRPSSTTAAGCSTWCSSISPGGRSSSRRAPRSRCTGSSTSTGASASSRIPSSTCSVGPATRRPGSSSRSTRSPARPISRRGRSSRRSPWRWTGRAPSPRRCPRRSWPS